jgi:signal transduction histidine kinase/fluoride ion exporter CrcB/FEX
MTVATSVPRPAAPPPATILLGTAVLGLLAATGSMALTLTSDAVGDDVGEPLVIALLLAWMVATYVFGGSVAWYRRPESRLGPLMVCAGLVTAASTLSWSQNDLLFTLGQALDKVPQVLFLHIFLAFPRGGLSGRTDRALVGVAYLAAVALELVRMTVGDYGPHNLISVRLDPVVFEAVRGIQLVTLSAACLGGVAVLVIRRRRESRPVRRWLTAMTDGFLGALVLIALLDLMLAWGGLRGWGVRELRWAVFLTLGVAPSALVAGLLEMSLVRSSVGDAVAGLPGQPSPTALREVIARALHDRSVTLAFWLPDYERWADETGAPVQLPGTGGGRAVTVIEGDGAPIAAIVHHASLLDEPRLLEAVSAAVAIALENGRLHTELRAQLHQLAGARSRLLTAAGQERQRLERELHDGAHRRLEAVSTELELLQERLRADPAARQRLAGVKAEIDLSLDELRDVARGIFPAVLTRHGLAVAVQAVAARSSVPLHVQIELDARPPEPVEVAAYFVICESLANIGKHAGASGSTVRITAPPGRLVVEIVDDGVGGARIEQGTGIRGLADRVEALEGELRVWSEPGTGTVVRAEIPCG